MAVLENLRESVSLAQKIDNIPLLRMLLDLQTEVQDLTQQVRELERGRDKLKEALAFRGSLSFENDAYWTADEGPFCSRCFDVDGKAVRMRSGVDPAWAHCPACKTGVKAYPDKEEPRPPKPRSTPPWGNRW